MATGDPILSGRGVRRPLLVLTHAAPRGVNDAPDHAHRGFASFRWLLDRLAPPLWLHGHATLVQRGIEARTARRNGTLLVNVTGATWWSWSRWVTADRDREPVPVGRYALVALLAVLVLLGITLLVRPLIFSLADPRDDARYALPLTIARLIEVHS